MNVFELFAVLSLDTKGYDSGLSDAKSKAQKFSSGVAKGAKIGAAAIAAVGTAVVGAGAAFVKQTGAVAKYGDHIDKMSQKIGISAEAYQEWDAIMQHSGASIDSLRPAMKTLATQAEKGGEAFQKLGISQQEVASSNTEQLFSKVIKSLQGMEEGTERTYLASQLLGRGATELGALLNTSAEETEKMRQKVHELGGVMSDEAVKAAAKYQDTLQDFQTGLQGMKRNLVSTFLPSVTTVMDGLTSIFTGSSKKGIKTISKGIDDLITKFTEKLPKVIKVVNGIIMALLKAIVKNLPKIFKSGADLIMELVNGIIQSLPSIVKAGMKAIIALAEGIAKNLDKLVPAIVDAILKIVETIIDNLPELLKAALEIIKALAKGILDALPILIRELPKIIKGIVDFIMGAIPEIIQAGIDLLMGLVEAIPEIIDALVEALPEIIFGIIDALLDPDNLAKMLSAGIELFVALVSDIPTIALEIIKRLPELVERIIDGFAEKIENGDFEKAGKAFIDGLTEGIHKAMPDFWKELDKIGYDIMKWFMDTFQIKSPSRVTRYFGNMIGKGWAIGIDETANEAMKAAKNLTDGVDSIFTDNNRSFDASIRMNDITASGSAYMSAQDGYLSDSDGYEEEIIIPREESDTGRDLTVILELDRMQLGRAVYRLNNEETQRVGLQLVGV